VLAALATLSLGRDLTLGFFDHRDGVHQAIILVNYDPVFADRPRITLKNNKARVLEVDQSTGQWVTLLRDDMAAAAAVAGAAPGVAINLPAGGGRLFVLLKGGPPPGSSTNFAWKSDDAIMQPQPPPAPLAPQPPPVCAHASAPAYGACAGASDSVTVTSTKEECQAACCADRGCKVWSWDSNLTGVELQQCPPAHPPAPPPETGSEARLERGSGEDRRWVFW
jgi:hypothetical protein